MTYSDIKQRVYDILDMPVAEAVRAGYSQKIHRIFNEATFRIAHSIMPNLRAYKFVLTKDKLPAKVSMPPDFISFADDQNGYVNGKNFIITDFIDKDSIIVTGKETEVIANEYEYTVYYNALYPELIDGGQNYRIYDFTNVVNADAYIETKQPAEGDNALHWSQIIGQLVPHYIVSQLLSNDDKTRSITEMNNFETLLATVNVDRNERQREYHSVRGWY